MKKYLISILILFILILPNVSFADFLINQPVKSVSEAHIISGGGTDYSQSFDKGLTGDLTGVNLYIGTQGGTGSADVVWWDCGTSAPCTGSTFLGYPAYRFNDYTGVDETLPIPDDPFNQGATSFDLTNAIPYGGGATTTVTLYASHYYGISIRYTYLYPHNNIILGSPTDTITNGSCYWTRSGTVSTCPTVSDIAIFLFNTAGITIGQGVSLQTPTEGQVFDGMGNITFSGVWQNDGLNYGYGNVNAIGFNLTDLNTVTNISVNPIIIGIGGSPTTFSFDYGLPPDHAYAITPYLYDTSTTTLPYKYGTTVNFFTGTSTGIVGGSGLTPQSPQIVCSGVNVLAYPICFAFAYLFVPSQVSVNQFVNLIPNLSGRFPFAYLANFQTDFSNLTASSSKNMTTIDINLNSLTVGSTTPMGNILPDISFSSSTVLKYIPTPIYNAFMTLQGASYFLALGYYIYRRVVNFHLT